jgi:hypothetical protein
MDKVYVGLKASRKKEVRKDRATFDPAFAL